MNRPTDKRRYIERRTYLIAAVRKRRRKVRLMAVEYKGGRCSICGYDRCINALEFHHLNPEIKDFGISDKGYARSWNRIKCELEQCILLCSNCHKEIHAGLQLSRVIGIEKSGEFRGSFAEGEATEAVRPKCLPCSMPTLSEACRRDE